MRQRIRDLRDRIAPDRRRQCANALPEHLAREPGLFAHATTVASYRAMGSEIDPEPTEAWLRTLGLAIVLPVTPPKGQPLRFHLFAPGDRLVAHRFGMSEPDPSRPDRRPDVLLVPLLAIDDQGNRLGYGGGYYDLTLQALRRGGTCVAIGLAFSEQRVDAVPHDAYDQRLDAVATPDGVFRFHNSDG
jgi:5-formyltetrahydrofolate cyclo-ligase